MTEELQAVSDERIRQILKETKTIATVGFSRSPSKPSHYVPKYLADHGYEVIPVNPYADEINGAKAYPDLDAIPQAVDLVQIFRPSADVPPHVDQAIEIGAKVVWMQQGIRHEPAATKAREAGLEVVMDKCMMVEHRRLLGWG